MDKSKNQNETQAILTDVRVSVSRDGKYLIHRFKEGTIITPINYYRAILTRLENQKSPSQEHKNFKAA